MYDYVYVYPVIYKRTHTTQSDIKEERKVIKRKRHTVRGKREIQRRRKKERESIYA